MIDDDNGISINCFSQVENEFVPQLNRVQTNVRSVNKTDVVTLLDMFENFAGSGLLLVSY